MFYIGRESEVCKCQTFDTGRYTNMCGETIGESHDRKEIKNSMHVRGKNGVTKIIFLYCYD